MWQWFIAFLVWLSSDPAAIGREAPRAAAAVAAARASLALDAGPSPAPAPSPAKCCEDCKGTGSIVHGDGHRTGCPCPASCKCKTSGAACPDGKCPPAKTVLR